MSDYPVSANLSEFLAYRAFAPATIRKYNNALNKYREFCAHFNCSIFPLNVDVLALYLVPAIQERTLYVVELLWQALGLEARRLRIHIPSDYQLYFRGLRNLAVNIFKEKRPVEILDHEEVMEALKAVWSLPDDADKMRTMVMAILG